MLLQISFCALFIVSSNVVADDFSRNNSKKAQKIFDLMVTYHGGESAIYNIDNVLVDYDYSTNYKTQGHKYQGTDYHSNRPGNLYSYLSLSKETSWSQSQYRYMNGIVSKTNIHRNSVKTVYNDVKETYQETTYAKFNNIIENAVLRNPALIVKALLKQKDNIRYIGTASHDSSKVHILSAPLDTGKTANFFVSAINGELKKLDYVKNNSLISYEFKDYQAVSGLKLPTFLKISLTDSAYPAYYLYHVNKYDFSADGANAISLPSGYKKADKNTIFDDTLRNQKIGKGIYWITKNGGNSLFVEFDDHIMAIDALDHGLDERIGSLRTFVKEKPISKVSISHHHHDHIDAVPYYFSNKSTIITAYEFIPLIDERIKVSLNPTNNKTQLSGAKYDTVDNKKVFTDGEQAVEVYKLNNTLHAEAMLMTYFPNEELVYMPDHFEFGSIIKNRDAQTRVLNEIKRLGLKVKGFITGHGNSVLSMDHIHAMMKAPLKFTKLRREPHLSVQKAQR